MFIYKHPAFVYKVVLFIYTFYTFSSIRLFKNLVVVRLQKSLFLVF